MIGINDFSYGKNVDEVFGNYKNIVNKLIERGIKVYIQSTILAGKKRKGLNKNITLLNDRLQILAQQNESITYIDLNKGLAPNFHLEASYTRDGVHLNGDGYAIWKELIKSHITNS